MKQKVRILLAISQTLMRVGLTAQIAAVAPEIEVEEASDFSQAQQSSCDVAIVHQTLLSERAEAIHTPFLVLTEQPTREELLLLRKNMRCIGYASLYPALEPLLSYFQTTNFSMPMEKLFTGELHIRINFHGTVLEITAKVG